MTEGPVHKDEPGPKASKSGPNWPELNQTAKPFVCPSFTRRPSAIQFLGADLRSPNFEDRPLKNKKYRDQPKQIADPGPKVSGQDNRKNGAIDLPRDY